MNIGLMVIELEEEHLGDNQVGTVIVDHSLQKDDSVFKEPAVDVENTFFAAAPLDHVGNQGHGEVLQAAPAPGKKSAAGIWGHKKKGESGEKGIRKIRLSQEKWHLVAFFLLFA